MYMYYDNNLKEEIMNVKNKNYCEWNYLTVRMNVHSTALSVNKTGYMKNIVYQFYNFVAHVVPNFPHKAILRIKICTLWWNSILCFVC